MSLDQHPYLVIYLTGSALVILLSFFKIALYWLIGWFTKENILQKNLRKIQAQRSFLTRSLTNSGFIIIESLLSWINVVIVIWQILVALLRTIRETFASKPEKIKALRFPLWNNPDMSRESVWAHLLALEINLGEGEPHKFELFSSLEKLSEFYPEFDQKEALHHLGVLKVIDEDIISETITLIDKNKNYQVYYDSEHAI